MRSGLAHRRRQRGVDLGAHGDAAGARRGRHRGDGLLDELVDVDLLHRPRDLAGFDPRELEEVVDERAQRAHVDAEAADVLAAGLGIADLVVDGVREQAQRGDGGAQVVRDRRDERAPRGVGLLATRLGGREA